MTKEIWKPGTLIYPVPAVMVSCGSEKKEYNIFTASWTGTICTDPAMCYVSIRPERHSYGIIKKNMEFVINLTTKKLARATDWCGVRSGRDYDKFKEMKLTPVQGSKVKAPLIKESPINIECVVKEIKPLGVHDMFIAEVVAVNADKKYLDPETGAFNLQAANPICYSHGKYYTLGEKLGKFGFSVEKKKTRKKRLQKSQIKKSSKKK
ncbi:MAG: flavin reductase family protein [Rhodothermaceae bacterium]